MLTKLLTEGYGKRKEEKSQSASVVITRLEFKSEKKRAGADHLPFMSGVL